MLEIGLWMSSGKIVVCCADGFWRSGNVDIVCQRYGVPLVKSFEELVPAVTNMLADKGMKIDQAGDLVGSNEHIEKAKPKKLPVLEAENAQLREQIEALQAQLALSKV